MIKNFLSIKNSSLIVVGILLCTISFAFSRMQSSRIRSGELRTKTRSLQWRSVEKRLKDSWSNGLVTFEVENSGETPVSVLSIEKGCGCVTAKMRSDVIPPGEVGFLDVTATPLVIGEKWVTIRLLTDSALSPEIKFDLQIIGSRLPPYLLSTTGDLSFIDSAVGTFEKFEVTTVAAEGDDREPQIECDLSFLKIERKSVTSKPTADDPTVYHFVRHYEVELRDNLPNQNFGGAIRIRDPWVSDRLLTVPISGQITPDTRVVPTRLQFDLASQLDRTLERKFVVIRRSHARETQVEVERDSDSPLFVERLPNSEGSQGEGFRVRLKQGNQSRTGIYNLIVRDPGKVSEAIILPVEVRGGE